LLELVDCAVRKTGAEAYAAEAHRRDGGSSKSRQIKAGKSRQEHPPRIWSRQGWCRKEPGSVAINQTERDRLGKPSVHEYYLARSGLDGL
jgi:hypothetical protein